ncbi:hypothetical protein MHJ63_09005 [Pseudoglutamicibacter albus]|uniref:hypothetical protein n=1 Tax=Pseudoglutamicibacter albus TaxID=98671 RepID=UPI001EF6E8F3|nr:hypothetical protein [Pseudoglutamicibacter albus]MCG7305399.1 hypothetical protein [Pseudoglutamicibacter albus]
MSVGDNLLWGALLVCAVLYWIYYVKVVRKPKSDTWYDSVWSLGSLYIFPYGWLAAGSVSAALLLAQLDMPKFVLFWFVGVPMYAGIAIGFIGFLGAGGVPLPYPFLPKWAVKKQKEEWARTIGYVKEYMQKLRDRLRSRRRK